MAYHFISGLPRSGSTLLAALLRQNPALQAGITSPIGSMTGAMLAEMSAGSESSVFFNDAQRRAVLRGLFDSYYQGTHPERTVFDTHRGWTARLNLVAELFPEAKVICCVRPVAWILDSVERLIRKNPLELSKIFGFEPLGNVYARAEGLMSGAGLIGFALNALKQAIASPQSDRLLLLPYDTLVEKPAAAMEAIYAFTGLPAFPHDFETISFDVAEFDARLGTPGLHSIRPKVAPVDRKTILPPDLWARYAEASLWRHPSFTRYGVRVACENPAPAGA